jgi:predicted HicB family RNase H-like nuclease
MKRTKASIEKLNKNKPGAPFKRVVKEHVLSVRMTPAQHQKLAAMSRTLEIPMNQWILNAIEAAEL